MGKHRCNVCGRLFGRKGHWNYHVTKKVCIKKSQLINCAQCGLLRMAVDPEHDRKCDEDFEHASFQSVDHSNSSARKIKLWCNLCKVNCLNRNWPRHQRSNMHRQKLQKLVEQQPTRQTKLKNDSIDDSKSSSNDGTDTESEQDSYVQFILQFEYPCTKFY